MLGISTRSVHRLINSGKLRVVRVGVGNRSAIRIPSNVLEEFLEGRVSYDEHSKGVSG